MLYSQRLTDAYICPLPQFLIRHQVGAEFLCLRNAKPSEYIIDQLLLTDDFPGFQVAQRKPLRTATRLYLKPHPKISVPM